MPDLVARAARYIETHALIPPDGRVLVGLSGGVDSVVLTHVLHRLEVDLVAAHVNYGLRGAASEGDEAFVRHFCSGLGLPLRVLPVDLGEEPASVQAKARAIRYRFFARQARRDGCTCVAVGHHRDDQAETLLLNLLRGSGPEGLAGMAPDRPLGGAPGLRLIRPLLDVRRADVEAYARAEGLRWCEDATNRSSKYRRGALRAEVLPLLEEHFGAGVSENLARVADLMRAYVEHTLRPELTERFIAYAEETVEGGRLDVKGLREAPPVWRRRLLLEALRRWLPGAPRSAAVAEEVEALLDAQVGRRVELGAGAVWRERGALHFAPASTPEAPAEEQELALGEAVEIPGGTVSADVLAARPERLDAGTASIAYADRDRLVFPLIVRPWWAGDRLRPLGLDGTKKVSDLLTEARVPPHRRSSVSVVCSENRIVWVAGYRLAHRARVRPETRRVVRLRLVGS